MRRVSSLPERTESSPSEPRSSRSLRILRPWLFPTIEIGVGVALIVLVTTVGHTLLAGVFTAVLGAAISFVSLLRVDGPATAWTLALALARIGLAVLPSVLLVRSAPRQRKMWLVP